MNIKTLSFLLVGFIAFIEVLADFFIKIAGRGPRYIDWRWFIPGFLIYMTTAVLWFFAIKYEKFFVASVGFILFSVLFSVALSIFYFKEHINAYEIIGIILAIISLILLGEYA